MLKEINSHPSSDMLLKYSMGNTTEAESLIISCHIAYCAECKEELKKYETIGGYYLSNHKELSVSKDLWKNILVKVDGLDQEQAQTNYTSHSIKSSLSYSDIKIPSTLSEYLGPDFDTKNWKSSINNIKGDLVVASSDEVHSPISASSGCICLVVYSGSLQFKGLLGSILNLTKF